MRVKSGNRAFTIFAYVAVGLFALFCLVPFVLIVSGSLTAEQDINIKGFRLIPTRVSLFAWKVLLADFSRVLTGYKVTVLVTALGTMLSLVVTSLFAYPISIPTLRYRRAISFVAIFTLLFSGGIVPWYIISVKVLHLRNTLLGLILPYTINAWNVFLLSNFFKSLPRELSESAKIDGANDLRIFVSIILPVSKAGLATVSLFIALAYWNDWWLGLMLIERPELLPLQLILRAIVSNIEFLRVESSHIIGVGGMMPSEGVKMAVAIVTTGPIILAYPFIQRYFIKGITLGAVKG
jgi:putative aldouronate transport system permease protein